MRWLFYLLLLFNAGLLALNYYHPPTSISDEGSDLPHGPRLVLLSELPPEQRHPLPKDASGQNPAPQEAAKTPPEPPPATAPAPLQPSFACYRLSGFDGEQERDEVAERLRKAGASLLERGVERTARPGYWVYLPPYKSTKTAQTVLRQLKEKGVTDFYLVKDEQNKNAISLGVFSRKDLAERRQTQIRGLGLRPKIGDVDLSGRAYWLALRWERGLGNLPDALSGATTVECPAQAPQR